MKNKISTLLLCACSTMLLYSCEEVSRSKETPDTESEVRIKTQQDTPIPPTPPTPWRADLDITNISTSVGKVGKVSLTLRNNMSEDDESVEAEVYIKLNAPSIKIETDKPFPRTVLVSKDYNGMQQDFGVVAQQAGVYTCRVIFKSLPDAEKKFYVGRDFTVTVTE